MLLAGGVLFVGTIALEARAGWLDRDPDIPVSVVIAELWPTLSTLWTVQMVAVALIAGAALLLLSDDRGAFGWPGKVVWSVVAIGALLATAGYAVSLNAYPVALELLDTQPELFATVRGAVAGLYRWGIMVAVVGLLALTVGEGLPARGRVPRAALICLLLAFVLAAGLSFAGVVTGMLAGGVVFVAPVVLGASLWLAGGRRSEG